MSITDRIEYNKYLNEYNYSFVLGFERKYFLFEYVEDLKRWAKGCWHMSIVYSIIYIIAIFCGQKIMEKREKFDLKRLLIAWNFTLAIFSFIGSIRFFPHFIFVLTTKGVDSSICVLDFIQGVPLCWLTLFTLSKYAELIDTLFIVLRKQKLIFLHWYHHATVLIYCWLSVRDDSSTSRWFILMNYIIHTFMYAYYAFRALRFQIPKWVNIAITTGQLSQMVVGIYVNTIAYIKKNRGERCDTKYSNIYWSFIMYFSYFLLFLNYFYHAYVRKPSNAKITRVHSKKE